MTETKRCNGCETVKPASSFARDKSRKDGLSSRCRDCQRLYMREWKERNGDHVRAYRQAHPRPLVKTRAHQARYRANGGKERQNEWRRRDRAANPEKYKVANARYYRANADRLASLNRDAKRRMKQARPEHVLLQGRQHAAKRKARLRAVTTETVDLARVLAKHGRVCHICRRPISSKPSTRSESLSFDHVIPIARGGPHAESNLAPAHLGCNSSKHTKLIHEPLAA